MASDPPAPSPATEGQLAPGVVPLGPAPGSAAAAPAPWRFWAGGAFVALAGTAGLWWLLYPAPDVRVAPIPQGQVALGGASVDPDAATGGPPPVLTLSPDSLTLVPGQSGTAAITINVAQGAAVIRSVTIEPATSDPLLDGATVASPFDEASSSVQGPFAVRSTTCPRPPAALQPGGGCVATIDYSGGATGPVRLVVRAERSGGGAATQVDALISPQTAPDVGAFPEQPGPPSGSYVEPARPEARVVYGPSQQEAYLERVRRAPIRASSFQQSTIADSMSPYAGWDAIGAEATESSLPVDMSRTITPDRPISAVLVAPINTAMTVTAVAMVDRDIYGAHDRRILLPRGTRIIGRIAGADTRVGISWSQIIRPDGVRFIFEGESGDAMGRGGVTGRKRERLAERYGWSALSAAVTAGVTVALGGRSSSTSAGGQTTETRDSRAEAADTLRAEAERISGDIFSRAQAIQPEISVPAGTRITVWALSDLRLKQLARSAPQSPPAAGIAFGGGVAEEVGQTSRDSDAFAARANYLPDGSRTIDDVPSHYEGMERSTTGSRGAPGYEDGYEAGLAAAAGAPTVTRNSAERSVANGTRTAGSFGGVRPSRPVRAGQPSAEPANPVPPWAR